MGSDATESSLGGRENCKRCPDEFDNLLKIVISGGERTRAIIYVFGLAFVSTFLLFFEYDVYDWSSSRYTTVANATNCYVHSIGASTPKDQTPLATLTRDCREYYDYVEKIYAIALLDHKTGRLFPEAREVLMERYKLATREAVDNLSTTVPVVGMKIDKNNFFVYGNVIMIIILYILLLSIRSEMRCLQDISPLALGNAARAKAIINSHMFSGQRQGRMAFAWIFLFFPSAMSLTRLYTDAETFAIPWKLLGPFWAILLLVLEVSSLVGLFALAVVCFRCARTLDQELGSLEASN